MGYVSICFVVLLQQIVNLLNGIFFYAILFYAILFVDTLYAKNDFNKSELIIRTCLWK